MRWGLGQEEVCPVKGAGAAWRTGRPAREARVGGGRSPGMPGYTDRAPLRGDAESLEGGEQNGVLRQAFWKAKHSCSCGKMFWKVATVKSLFQ